MREEELKKLNEFVARADSMKKQEKMDLSSDQDLSLAVMNLVSIEEHFFFTGAKTGKTEYFDLVDKVRELRKGLLKQLVKNPDGEVWCISKHLLAASMRLMEVGTKQQTIGNKEAAYEMFKKSFDVYSLFWALNMDIIGKDGVKAIDSEAVNRHDKEKSGFFGKLGDIVKKAIDCCRE